MALMVWEQLPPTPRQTGALHPPLIKPPPIGSPLPF
jgi:hypothetical protein